MNTTGLTQKQIDLAKALFDSEAFEREQEAAKLKMDLLRLSTLGYFQAQVAQ